MHKFNETAYESDVHTSKLSKPHLGSHGSDHDVDRLICSHMEH